jgi:Flp pilus assembly protein TadB
MTTSLFLLSLACWAAPRASAGRRQDERPARAAVSLRAMQACAACASVVTCGLMFGLRAGIVAGAVVASLAWRLIARLALRSAVGGPARELAEIPLVLDLVGTALRSGQPLEGALFAAAPAAGPWSCAELRQVAGLLRLGATPADAWRRLGDEPLLRPVTETAIRSADSGIRLARAFAELAAQLRADASAAAAARAHRVGVWAVAPLGLCFLPGFVCLGIAPIVIGVAHGLLDGPQP